MEYRVQKNILEAPGVHTLYFECPEHSDFSYEAGQYINVTFEDLQTPEGKAYTISSAPHEEYLSLTVKEIGIFSRKLCSLEVGNHFTASLPYGYFRPEFLDSVLVLCAGGIGITPFRSIILDALNKNPERSITLLHSIKKIEDAVFKKEFEMLSEKYPAFKIKYFVTQEEVADGQDEARRIDPTVDIIPDSSMRAEYLICGSIEFTCSLWRGTKSIGVPEDYIYTEAFFSH